MGSNQVIESRVECQGDELAGKRPSRHSCVGMLLIAMLLATMIAPARGDVMAQLKAGMRQSCPSSLCTLSFPMRDKPPDFHSSDDLRDGRLKCVHHHDARPVWFHRPSSRSISLRSSIPHLFQHSARRHPS
jgi:hypothetical protein